MAISSERWKQITPSQFPWEREALDYLREHLPDCDPYRVWANFEFIADDGTINEVDVLILTPRGFFLIEIKSKPGTLSGDRATWVWTHDGRSITEDNPIILANRKAKKLASLLKRQKACQKIRLPYLDPLVFCSNETLDCRLQGVDRYRICLRDRETTVDRPAVPGIIAALKFRNVEGLFDNYESLIDRPAASAISRAMEQAGIRPSQKSRRVGDYVLGNLLFESPTGTYQDWEAVHFTFAKMLRRVRIYTASANSPAIDRQTIRKAAKREFELLEGLHHPGILEALDFTEHELGPALVFRHDPDSIRLDHFLAQYGEYLSIDDRLSLVRQIGEALNYAHEKRILHRALSPQSLLVTEPQSPKRRTKIFNWQTGRRLASTTNSQGLSLVTPTLHPEQLVEDASTVYMAPEAITEPGSLGEHLDVFSLGAIAYHIFTGKAPAGNLFELGEKLRIGSGLAVSSVLDGAGAWPDDKFRMAGSYRLVARIEIPATTTSIVCALYEVIAVEVFMTATVGTGQINVSHAAARSLVLKVSLQFDVVSPVEGDDRARHIVVGQEVEHRRHNGARIHECGLQMRFGFHIGAYLRKAIVELARSGRIGEAGGDAVYADVLRAQGRGQTAHDGEASLFGGSVSQKIVPQRTQGSFR